MLTRRNILQAAMLGGAQFIFELPSAKAEIRMGATARDRFWLWSHVAGAYTGEFNLVGPSRITPAEAACYMSIPNVFMVEYNGRPAPSAWEQFSVPFQALHQVSWSIVPPGNGISTVKDRDVVLDFAFKNPEITSVVMDDFFVHRKGWAEGQVAALSLDQLRELKKSLQRGAKRLDLWTVLYAHQVNDASFSRLAPYLELSDIVQVWPWYGKEIPALPETLARVEKTAPGKKLALGCFMWDFGGQKPLPVSAMRQQCDLGLKWLHAGRIEAMIFGASWLCDRKLEAVDWTRQWIRKVGSQKV